ncbi:hypothetical protein AMQ83_13000 [Paenibacillus riograndensis]|nr:hypothetical protein AMQ83_13000 [Paenibacillus riograndensis]
MQRTERHPTEAAGPVKEPAAEQRPAEEAGDGKAPKKDLEIGDAVYVNPLDRMGIVYETRDAMGMVGVMVQKQKMRFNHKRLKPYLSKEELYPEEYDFDIIFESKETRKKRKLMRKRHVEGLSIIHEEEEK